ncbi:MAG: hypothetical protein ACYDAE_02530 [Steroidobacteraceae bacterium]
MSVKPEHRATHPSKPQAIAAVRDPPSHAERPTMAEIGLLIALMNEGNYARAEDASRALLERHPAIGFVVKLHGIALMMQGKDVGWTRFRGQS